MQQCSVQIRGKSAGFRRKGKIGSLDEGSLSKMSRATRPLRESPRRTDRRCMRMKGRDETDSTMVSGATVPELYVCQAGVQSVRLPRAEKHPGDNVGICIVPLRLLRMPILMHRLWATRAARDGREKKALDTV